MEQPDSSQENFNSNQPTYTDKEVFTQIWFSPRKIFRFINDTWYENHMIPLLCLAGIARAFDNAYSGHMGNTMSLLGIMCLCIIGGGLFGWIWVYLYSALIAWTGKWFKGQGDAQSIMRVMAYASIPTITTLILFLIQIIIYGNSLFQSDLPLLDSDNTSIIIANLFSLIKICLGLWTVVLSVVGISEVQKISIGEAILNLITAGAMIIVPIIILVVVFIIATK
ncbi:MAG TPA: Yip1 family protein [Bacteroidia bacterium]|nr:Yip1 family protein [Bacteroidia bacterium]